MIYTLTLNPSVDYIVSTPPLREGFTNRAVSEQIYPGGKGINVSLVLSHLGIENTALGFIAGFTGKQINAMLADNGCVTDFTEIENGFSRINIKIKSERETEINGLGPDISQKHIDSLYKKLERLDASDMLVLAGSVPKSVSEFIYRDILKYAAERNISVAVDTSRKLLANAIPEKPFLIKPNKQELEEIFDKELNTAAEITDCAKLLRKAGARNVLVSLAGSGAILVSEQDKVYTARAPEGKVVNSVGAGDSMVAGFIAGYIERHDYEHAFKMGIAAGSASAFSQGLATKQEILDIYKTITL